MHNNPKQHDVVCNSKHGLVLNCQMDEPYQDLTFPSLCPPDVDLICLMVSFLNRSFLLFYLKLKKAEGPFLACLFVVATLPQLLGA